jgi:hypothetical protein
LSIRRMTKAEKRSFGMPGKLRRYADEAEPGEILTRRQMIAKMVQREQEKRAWQKLIAEEEAAKPQEIETPMTSRPTYNLDGSLRKKPGRKPKENVPTPLYLVSEPKAALPPAPVTNLQPNSFERVKENIQVLRASVHVHSEQIETIRRECEKLRTDAREHRQATLFERGRVKELSQRMEAIVEMSSALKDAPQPQQIAANENPEENHAELLKRIYTKCQSLITNKKGNMELRKFCMLMSFEIEEFASSVTD